MSNQVVNPNTKWGLQHKVVRIEEINDFQASVRDRFGKLFTARTDIHRTGMTPAKGEVWIVDRSLGEWTFVGLMKHKVLGGVSPVRHSPGLWYGPSIPNGITTVGLALTGNVMYLVPFWVGYQTTFDRLNITFTAAQTVGDVVRVGIYTDNGLGIPGTILIQGSMALLGAGNYSLTISQTLAPGEYWLAAVCQVATVANTLALDCGPNPFVGTTAPAAAAAYHCGYSQSGVTGVMPTSPIISGRINRYAPYLSMRAA